MFKPMSNTLSPELQKQIEQEAKSNAANFLFHPGSSECEDLESAHITAASKYALKWEQAEQLIEQMAKALLYISNGGATPVRKANQALTDYNNYKKGKDGE
jgi:hypothetical protein